MLSIHCPSCGGTNIFDETKYVPTYCAFCGSHLPDMTQFVQESLKLGLDKKRLKLDQQRHEMKVEELDKEITKEKVKTFGSSFDSAVLLIIMIPVLFIIIFAALKAGGVI